MEYLEDPNVCFILEKNYSIIPNSQSIKVLSILNSA
jgi:hypothetical protein